MLKQTAWNIKDFVAFRLLRLLLLLLGVNKQYGEQVAFDKEESTYVSKFQWYLLVVTSSVRQCSHQSYSQECRISINISL